MTAPICFVDTETTSLRPDRQAWEIAIIRRDDQGETETCFMVDVDLTESDPFALAIGRFYERHPYGRYLSNRIPDPFIEISEDDQFLRPRDAAHAVARLTHGAHLIGAVPGFDAEVFAQLLRDHKLAKSWHYHLVDVENMAVGYLRGLMFERGDDQAGDPDLIQLVQPPWSSEELSRAIGVEPSTEEERHTALGDARWAKRIYDAVMGGTDG